MQKYLSCMILNYLDRNDTKVQLSFLLDYTFFFIIIVIIKVLYGNSITVVI